MPKFAFLVVVALFSACLAPGEGEGDGEDLGKPCTPDNASAIEELQPRDGTNNLVRGDQFTECGEALCATVNGSDPFCTRGCSSDATCNGGTCERLVTFGELACADFTLADDCLTSTQPLSYGCTISSR